MRGLSLGEIEAVYRTHGAAFERVAVAVARDEGLGCDAVQDAFVRAVRSRHTFRGDALAAAWLWRIVLNEARRSRAEQQLPPALLGEVVEEPSTNGRADRALIRASIAALPERQRLALFLRYYADLDYETIAATLDIQPGTVAATLHTARRRLAVDLEQEVHEWET